MLEEEKKAIETLKQTSKQCHNSKECWENEDCCDCYVEVEDILAIDTILNLIEKQQKEINELKVINNIQKYRIEVIDERELIPKSKIEDKIKN